MRRLNRAEGRVLRRAALLLGLAVAARVGLAPPPGEPGWRPDTSGAATPGGAAGPAAGAADPLDAFRAAVGSATRKKDRASRPLAPGERVPVNRAPPEELQRLPGIGPVLAGRIVAHREVRGGFRSVEDLLEVSGIGPATLERLRSRVRLP